MCRGRGGRWHTVSCVPEREQRGAVAATPAFHSFVDIPIVPRVVMRWDSSPPLIIGSSLLPILPPPPPVLSLPPFPLTVFDSFSPPSADHV